MEIEVDYTTILKLQNFNSKYAEITVLSIRE